MPLMKKFIHPGSIIISDDWRAYRGCQKWGFREHKIVVHKYHFVCPKNRMVHTNSIERFWR
jgi:hypothetical protein